MVLVKINIKTQDIIRMTKTKGREGNLQTERSRKKLTYKGKHKKNHSKFFK